MINKPVMNRNLVVLGALLIQLSLGAIYAWSVFTKPLVDAGWSKTDTQIIFSTGLAVFAIVMVIAGRLMPRPKIGPRKLSIAGGIAVGVGYMLAGLAPTNFWVLLVCIGIIAGSGIGMAYVVPIAVGIRWFPDKKGLITGLAVAGFGFGAMLWMKLAGEWGNFLTNYGLGGTFVIYGHFFFIMVVIGGIWMVFPPEGWKPLGWQPPKSTGNAPAIGSMDFESGQMLRTPQFYMIFVTFLFSASAGLMCIGLMKLYPSQALVANGIDKMDALAISGTAMAVCFALANGIGRIAWGEVSDLIGRKLSLVIMTALQGVMMLAFPYMAGYTMTLYIAATLIGFNFGGNFALFPTVTADIFGNKYVGQNYGWVFLAYGIGGIFGPIMGGILGDMGNFSLAFTIVGLLCLLAAAIIGALKPPIRTTQETEEGLAYSLQGGKV